MSVCLYVHCIGIVVTLEPKQLHIVISLTRMCCTANSFYRKVTTGQITELKATPPILFLSKIVFCIDRDEVTFE